LRILDRTGRVVLGLALAWWLLGLMFRAFFYASLPVSPGEPYGIADVLELFHFGVLLLLCGALAVLGVMIAVLRGAEQRLFAVVQLVAAPLLVFGYLQLHRIVASLGF